MGSKSIKTGLDSTPSIATAGTVDEGLNLYEDLMAFTMLTPEEQEANAGQYKSQAAVAAPQPTGELSSGCVEIGQADEPADGQDSPQMPEPPRNTIPSAGITRAATITVYKSQARQADGENPNQGFVVLDAEELLSEDAADESNQDHEDETLNFTGPLDVQFSHGDGKARVKAVCRSCGYQSDGEDLLCLGCGDLLDEPAPGEGQPA